MECICINTAWVRRDIIQQQLNRAIGMYVRKQNAAKNFSNVVVLYQKLMLAQVVHSGYTIGLASALINQESYSEATTVLESIQYDNRYGKQAIELLETLANRK